MKILYLGGQTAGLIGLLTLGSQGYYLDIAAYSNDVFQVAESLFYSGFRVRGPLDFNPVYDGRYDLIVSVHGRQIVPDTWLSKTPGINLHPCLYGYKGKDPVGRALAAGETKFSVGAHRMTAEVDMGEVLVERFVEIPTFKWREVTIADRMVVYQHLYPLYAVVLLEALRKV